MKASKIGSSRSCNAKPEPITSRSSDPPRRRDGADLTGPDRQPPGVECGTERHPRLHHAVPGELDELGLLPQQLQAAGQARLGGRTVEDKIIVTGSVIGMHQVDTQRSGEGRS